MAQAAFRDPGNLRHQVGLVLTKIWDAIEAGDSASELVLGLDALCWTYVREDAGVQEALAEARQDFEASDQDDEDEVRYRLRCVAIYVDKLRHSGVIDRAPVSVSDATDYLQDDGGD